MTSKNPNLFIGLRWNELALNLWESCFSRAPSFTTWIWDKVHIDLMNSKPHHLDHIPKLIFTLKTLYSVSVHYIPTHNIDHRKPTFVKNWIPNSVQCLLIYSTIGFLFLKTPSPRNTSNCSKGSHYKIHQPNYFPITTSPFRACRTLSNTSRFRC